MRLRGQLHKGALQRALDRIVERHEALRTTFTAIEGVPVQRIADERSGFALLEQDLGEEADAEGAVSRIADEEVRQGFDLERGPLIRGRLLRVGAEEHVLLVTMHHIVSDGWSIAVLIEELGKLY